MLLTKIFSFLILLICNNGFIRLAQETTEITNSAPVSFSDFKAGIIGIPFAVFTAFLTSIITLQSEAKHGRHRQFYYAMIDLEILFKDSGCMENQNPANPFCLLYTQNVRNINFQTMRIPFGDRDVCQQRFFSTCERIEKLIYEEKNNAKPRGISKEKWNHNQEVLHQFALMIIEKRDVESKNANTGEHDLRWKELKDTVKEMKTATEYSIKESKLRKFFTRIFHA